MTRLQSYLLNENRTQNINKEEALNILKTKCKKAWKYYKGGNYICRDIYGFHGSFGVIYPKSGERVSRNTTNYYTLIINNDPIWKKYPKREVICETDGRYPHDYIVFPFDGAKMGICPDVDIWASFGDIDPSILNDEIDSLIKGSVTTYTDMKKQLMNLKDLEHFKSSYRMLHRILSDKQFDSLWDVVMSVYGNPKKYGFEVKKIGDKLPDNKEVWTDSPCLFMYYSTIGDFEV